MTLAWGRRWRRVLRALLWGCVPEVGALKCLLIFLFYAGQLDDLVRVVRAHPTKLATTAGAYLRAHLFPCGRGKQPLTMARMTGFAPAWTSALCSRATTGAFGGSIGGWGA
jgi:hypothetical protein